MGEDLAVQNEWREKFAIPLRKRWYLAIAVLSELAVKNTLEALAITKTAFINPSNGNRKDSNYFR
jgi:hypothetical protein